MRNWLFQYTVDDIAYMTFMVYKLEVDYAILWLKWLRKANISLNYINAELTWSIFTIPKTY